MTGAADLSPETWALIGMIAGGCVFICLGAIARALEVEAKRLELQREVRHLRKQYALMVGQHHAHARKAA